MRVNVRKVYNAWKLGKSCDMKSISTDGQRIYSYATILVERCPDGSVMFNDTKYSATTSCQQSGLRFALSQDGIDSIPVGHHIPRGRSFLYDEALHGAGNV